MCQFSEASRQTATREQRADNKLWVFLACTLLEQNLQVKNNYNLLVSCLPNQPAAYLSRECRKFETLFRKLTSAT